MEVFATTDAAVRIHTTLHTAKSIEVVLVVKFGVPDRVSKALLDWKPWLQGALRLRKTPSKQNSADAGPTCKVLGRKALKLSLTNSLSAPEGFAVEDRYSATNRGNAAKFSNALVEDVEV